MRANYIEAEKYLNLCEKLCPGGDKRTLEKIYVERLHLLERTDIDAAIALAKSQKSSYRKTSIAFISSNVTIAQGKDAEQRLKALVRLEKQARKEEYFTLANNILFDINSERNNVDKLKQLDKAIESDRSSYNFCRATIYKHQTLVESGM
ncbi:hypothetical protein EAY50_20750, partial [Vibrio anguillarum]|nr:hypothetical protein [Vibrio anguillarum]